MNLKCFDDNNQSFKPEDVVMTPINITEKIVNMFTITGSVLEPFKGSGNFLKFLPSGSDWCEIREGKDFFEYTGKVDWIISNPPYTPEIFRKSLDKCFEVSDNIVLIIPFSKIFKSMGTLNKVFDYGGIVSIHYLSASKCGFAFGYPCGVFYFKRGYKGETKIEAFQ